MSVLRELAEKAQMAEDSLIRSLKTVNYSMTGKTTNGAMADTYHYLGLIPYNKWRVVRMGVLIHEDGASGVAEKYGFGYFPYGDVIQADMSLFGVITQDDNSGKEFKRLDFISRGANKNCSDVADDFLQNDGTPSFDEGGGQFNKWQTNPGLLLISKLVASGSTSTGRGFMVVEVA